MYDYIGANWFRSASFTPWSFNIQRITGSQLINLDGIPRIHYIGTEGDNNILVMDLLGPSLEELMCFCGGKFSLKTVLILADKLVFIKSLQE